MTRSVERGGCDQADKIEDAYVDDDVALYRGGLDWIVDLEITLQINWGFREKILLFLSTELMLGMLSRSVRVSEL